MTRPRWLCAGLTLLLVMAACAGNGNDEPDATPSTTSPTGDSTTVSADPCDGVTLEETEIGVTEDKIVVEVVADVSGPGVSDHAGAAVAAVKAWADDVNDRGGLACRKVEVREWDSRLAPNDTARGAVDACENAVAMVGTSALLMIDTSSLATCPDEGRAAIGVPDLAERAIEVPHQCNPTTYAIVATPGACPYAGGPRQFVELIGPYRYLASLTPAASATIIAAGETPSAGAASDGRASAAQAAGVLTIDGSIAATEHDRSESTARALDLIATAGSTIVHSEANASVLAELRKQATDSGVGSAAVWACSSACYWQSFVDRDETDGTYVWVPHLPFEEADSVPALARYVEAVDDDDKTSSSGLAAWTAAITFEQVVERIVERNDLNSVTRANILDQLAALRNGTASVEGTEVYGPDHSVGAAAKCFVVLRVRNGEFRRVHPAAPGTLDCAPENLVTVERDPAAPLA